MTHASSSCFILVNSSLVMEPSPSPNFWSFSLEASKSGLGGAGGIYIETAGDATCGHNNHMTKVLTSHQHKHSCPHAHVQLTIKTIN